MQGMPVGIRVDGHGFDARFLAGSHNADGNFTAVSDKDLLYQALPALMTQLMCGKAHFC
jgi:hypothetical protein